MSNVKPVMTAPLLTCRGGSLLVVERLRRGSTAGASTGWASLRRCPGGSGLRARGWLAVQPDDGDDGQDGFGGEGDQRPGGEAGRAGDGQVAVDRAGSLDGAGGEQADAPDGGQAHLGAAREAAGRVAGEPGPAASRGADQGPPGGE